MALDRKVSVEVEMRKGADTLSPALDQTKTKADAATTSLEKAKTAGSQVAAVPPPQAAGSQIAATAPSGASVSATVRASTAVERSIAAQQRFLERNIATAGMSTGERKIFDLERKGATGEQLAPLRELAAQDRRVKAEMNAAKEAEQTAKQSALFGQDNNRLQERISKVQRVAGLAGAAMVATGVGGTAGNIAGAALGGAAAGAMFGPLGAGIGAAVGGLGAFTQSLASTTERLAEAGKRASTIFAGEATLRALRRGDRLTDASLIAAAPEAMGRIAALPPAERAAALRREAAAATIERARIEALPSAEAAGWFGRFANRLDTLVGFDDDLRTPERVTAARTAEAALAGAVKAVDTGIGTAARVASGGSGGVGFREESIMAALTGETDESTGLLKEIRDALVGREDLMKDIRDILSPGAT